MTPTIIIIDTRGKPIQAFIEGCVCGAGIHRRVIGKFTSPARCPRCGKLLANYADRGERHGRN